MTVGLRLPLRWPPVLFPQRARTSPIHRVVGSRFTAAGSVSTLPCDSFTAAAPSGHSCGHTLCAPRGGVVTRFVAVMLALAAASACGQATDRATSAVTPATASSSSLANDGLPSWNDGQAKRAINDFVRRVTREGSGDFVPPAERIAVFDNDGTLWAEQP